MCPKFHLSNLEGDHIFLSLQLRQTGHVICHLPGAWRETLHCLKGNSMVLLSLSGGLSQETSLYLIFHLEKWSTCVIGTVSVFHGHQAHSTDKRRTLRKLVHIENLHLSEPLGFTLEKSTKYVSGSSAVWLPFSLVPPFLPLPTQHLFISVSRFFVPGTIPKASTHLILPIFSLNTIRQIHFIHLSSKLPINPECQASPSPVF